MGCSSLFVQRGCHIGLDVVRLGPIACQRDETSSSLTSTKLILFHLGDSILHYPLVASSRIVPRFSLPHNYDVGVICFLLLGRDSLSCASKTEAQSRLAMAGKRRVDSVAKEDLECTEPMGVGSGIGSDVHSIGTFLLVCTSRVVQACRHLIQAPSAFGRKDGLGFAVPMLVVEASEPQAKDSHLAFDLVGSFRYGYLLVVCLASKSNLVPLSETKQPTGPSTKGLCCSLAR